jgi:hypothetical protein
MASTYVNDLRLNEMATGDASGTWGTTTNTNLELIAEAFSYGTEAITTNADTHTTTIADGATDPGRSLYLKYTGTLDSACTITIGPNTVSKVWIVENGTSGSQDIILSQGSGANITIPAGDTKVVYSDGAGAGAAFVDAFASLSVVDLKVQDDLTVTDDASVGGDLTITGASTAATYNGIASKTFGTGSIMIGDTTTGTIDAANYNVGLGVDVFAALTSGDNNTAIGTSALTANTTGTQNTALGATTLDANTTGENNTALGWSALTASTTASGNTAVGSIALFVNTTGANNVAVGQEAMRYNTTASKNTAVGYQALLANTTGTQNIAVGAEALAANTTADNNVAVGYLCLNDNTTGTENSAVGNFTLDVNTTGSNNTGLGYGALSENTTASNNTAVGYLALLANTTGTANVAVGALALDANTTVSNSTAVGYGALTDQSSGNGRNTAMGYLTLENVTSGDSNVGIGYLAGGQLTTGVANTFIGGGEAGITNPAGYSVTTGNANTFLGHSAGALITTGSNNTIIGSYSGNQGGLDIRTADNHIVLSDGDGNPRLRIDSGGNTTLIASTITGHVIAGGTAANDLLLNVSGINNACAIFYSAGVSGENAAAAAIKVTKSGATGRSINAAGTINASGADYAEYENNGGLIISKGSIVGFKADGELTLTFSEAIRFAVKSTSPAYVGGDVWGNDTAIGIKPIKPTRIGSESDADFASRESEYAIALPIFEAALEAARQLVDRIAYSGKVPVNIQNATAGDYIIAVAADDGSIDGQAITAPDFAQYKLAVGRVNRILEDGRAEIAVIIH